MRSRGAAQASEVAQVFASMVGDTSAWTDEAVLDLERLLGHRLAAPTPGRLRQARLGLLIHLVSTGDGVVIDTVTYDVARATAKELGEEWPDSSALIRAFGNWLAAVRAAMRFWFDGGKARVPADLSHARPIGEDYTPAEVCAALNACARTLNVTEATEGEYAEWRRLSRRGARRVGKPLPRHPAMRTIRTMFGDYASAAASAASYEGP